MKYSDRHCRNWIYLQLHLRMFHLNNSPLTGWIPARSSCQASSPISVSSSSSLHLLFFVFQDNIHEYNKIKVRFQPCLSKDEIRLYIFETFLTFSDNFRNIFTLKKSRLFLLFLTNLSTLLFVYKTSVLFFCYVNL